MTPRKALIPAAGLGTRFLPATKIVPKELLPIVDRPALEYIVEELADSGIEEIVLVIHPEKEAVFQHFCSGGWVEETLRKRGQMDRLKQHPSLLERVKFRKAYQHEAKGLGHAVLCGREEIGPEPFLVVLPDDLVRSRTPCALQLVKQFKKDGRSVVAVEWVSPDRVPLYGIVGGSRGKSRRPFPVTELVEKPSVKQAPSQWAIIGRYVFEPEIFEAIEETRAGTVGEIQLTDAMRILARARGLTAYPFEGLRLDAGQPDGFLEANLLYAMDDRKRAAKIRSIVRGRSRRRA